MRVWPMRPQRKHSRSVLPFSPPSPLRFSENLLAVPDFQAIQLSIVTFHRFVTSGMMVAVFVTQISHHHWSETAGTTVDDCHDVSLLFCMIWEQMLLGCHLLFKFSGAHGKKNSQSHVFWQLVSSAFSVALFQIFPGLDGVSILAAFGGDKICLLSAADGAHKAASLRPVSAIVPNLVLVQLLGQSPELLLPSSRPKNVALLDPSRSSLCFHVEGVSQRLAASGSLRPSSPASALRALRRRSPPPNMTKFSNSAHSSFRTSRAPKSSAPPAGCATSYRPYCGEHSVLGASLGVLQTLFAGAPAVRGWFAPPTWQRWDLVRRREGSATMQTCAARLDLHTFVTSFPSACLCLQVPFVSPFTVLFLLILHECVRT